jgi:hypothetical protein
MLAIAKFFSLLNFIKWQRCFYQIVAAAANSLGVQLLA